MLTMRHLPWYRLGAAAAVISILVLLSRYVTSPVTLVPGKRDHDGGAEIAFHGGAALSGAARGQSTNDRLAEEGAAVAAASQKEFFGEPSLNGDVLPKDPEPPKGDRAANDEDLGEKASVVKGRTPERAAGDGAPKPDQQPQAGEGRSEGKPVVAEGVSSGPVPAVRQSQDRPAKPFEGLPLNVVVDIKGSKPVVQEAVQPGPPKEATVEQLKKFFEPDMTSKKFNSTVLVITPLRNARGHLTHYLELLLSLSYPHDLISVALGEDSSVDGTYELATSLAKDKLSGFRRVSVFHLDHVLYQATDWSSVHAEGHQLERRRHLARARNELLSRALYDEEFVLWVDSDVGTWPADIVQHLLDAHVDIVVPACMWRSNEGHVDVYDRNTWRETPESLARQQMLGENYLMLEGYGGRPRLTLPDLRSERQRMVKVDGVGGCVLLIRSIVHRRGLVFPAFVFRHHVETEGLAKMATDMGYQCYGLPFLEVYHL